MVWKEASAPNPVQIYLRSAKRSGITFEPDIPDKMPSATAVFACGFVQRSLFFRRTARGRRHRLHVRAAGMPSAIMPSVI
jgi:hypothetical protein